MATTQFSIPSIIGLVFASQIALGFHLETVSGPSEENESTIVRRYAQYLTGEAPAPGQKDTRRVILLKCDETEVSCTPDSRTRRLRREMSFDSWQTHLAELFRIEPRYLLNHEKTVLNLESLTKTLQEVIDAGSTDDEEKKRAREKFDNLTRKGGIKDRFTQAVAIKKALLTNPNIVSFEKSQIQYAQAGYPFDFVPDKELKDPSVVYEPSTERTFWLAGAQTTRSEAERLCATKGKHFKLIQAVGEIPAWLYGSAIGVAIASSANRGKGIWLAGSKVSERQVTVEKPDNEPNYGGYNYPIYRDGRVRYIKQASDANFGAATINADGVTKSDVVVEGILDDKRSKDEILAALAEKAGRLATICVSSAPEDDTY